MNSQSSTNTDYSQSQSAKNLFFVDSNVEDYQSLISILPSEAELLLWDSFADNILQISEKIGQYEDIEAIHLITENGLSDVPLTGNILNRHSDLLHGWSDRLTHEADILLHGYDVNAVKDGDALINQLADITQADVATSATIFADSMSSDFQWDIQTGMIEVAPIFENPIMMNAHDMMTGSHSHTSYLAPHSEATHIAVNSGKWFDSSTWKNGQIPDDEAEVLIPQNVAVRYNGTSDARLDTLRVDGVLNFATRRNTQMMVDTFIVSPQGKLNIGNQNNSVKADKTAKIIFTSDRAIDSNSDPKQLGKGLISEGRVGIYGAEKLDFVPIQGNALAGENELVLQLPQGMNSPTGWQVGDQLVLGGTYFRYQGSNEDNSKFHDEVLTITKIDGDRISFTNNDISSGDNTVLRFDHQRPEGFEKRVNLYVANTTRNVVLETEKGKEVPIANRAHVMFMHNPNVVVQNAGFYNLGRTDKNQLIDDPGRNVDGAIGKGTNPRGRYSLHFHRTGADNLRGKAAIAKGNAVVGSPGWGIAHHDSHANLEDNVVFDVVGAGIAAEAGNEIGTWRNNITIKTIGDDRNSQDLSPTSPRVNRFDFGFNGEGYWVQGAGQIDIVDNIAISAAEVGIIHYGGGDGGQDARDAQTIPVANLPPEWRSIAQGTEDETVIDVAAVPLRKLTGFESYNSKRGMGFWGSMKNIDAQLTIEGAPRSKGVSHDFYSEIENFTLWNVRDVGVSMMYSSQIELDGGLIVGNRDRTSQMRYLSRAGISGNFGANQNRFNNLEINSFETGLNLPLDSNLNYASSSLANSTFSNNAQNLASRKYNNRQYTDYPTYFEMDQSNSFEIPKSNVSPTSQFGFEAVGGLGVKFDGGSSFDGDSSELDLLSQGIVSYAWDFDNDGTVEKYGRQVGHYFDSPGSHQVALTVWDNQGAANTVVKNVEVRSSLYKNLIMDNQFSYSGSFGRLFDTRAINQGWMSGNNVAIDRNLGDGGAVVSKKNGNGRIAQVILDEGMRRGKQTLSIDLKNIEGTNRANEITVTVWGVEGEFQNRGWTIDGPQSVGASSLNRQQLLQETVGGSDFDWTTFKWDLDFGDGHQFIVFQVNYAGVLTTVGDFVGIDNVKIR